MRQLVSLSLLILVVAVQAGAQMDDANARTQTFENGAAEFDAGAQLLATDPEGAQRHLRQAIRSFESMTKSGVENGPLHYNIGNAYALLDEPGHAMLAYRRAERYMPGDPNLQANIAALTPAITDDEHTASSNAFIANLRSILIAAPLRPAIGIAIGAWILFWALLIARRLVRVRIPFAVAAAALAFTLSAATIAGAAWAERTDRRAVVIEPDTVGRKGPGIDAYAPSFAEPIPVGLTVDVIATRPQWWLIRLPDGRETWAPSDHLERIRPADG